jgi:hypothetical protein
MGSLLLSQARVSKVDEEVAVLSPRSSGSEISRSQGNVVGEVRKAVVREGTSSFEKVLKQRGGGVVRRSSRHQQQR